MKKILASAIALTLMLPAAGPALADPSSHANHGKNNHGKAVSKVAKANYKAWRKGERFDRRYAANYRVVDYRSYNRLSAPPRGYQWVRSGDDALLVAVTTGVIASVIGNIF